MYSLLEIISYRNAAEKVVPPPAFIQFIMQLSIKILKYLACVPIN